MKVPTLAVVGCGYWGPNLIRNFHALPDCRLAVCCNTRRERLAWVERMYPGVATGAVVVGNPARIVADVRELKCPYDLIGSPFGEDLSG